VAFRCVAPTSVPQAGQSCGRICFGSDRNIPRVGCAKFSYYRHAKIFEQGDDLPLSIRWRYKVDRWRSHCGDVPVRSETDASAALPACGTLVGATATKCHQCGASMRFSFAAASKSLGRWMPQTSRSRTPCLRICLRDVWPVNDHFCANAGFRLAQRNPLSSFDEPRRDFRPSTLHAG